MGRKDAMARCPEYDRQCASERRADPARRDAWEEHLRSCSSCQAQDLADRALRSLLGGLPRPQLPPGFAERCANRALRARRNRS